MERIGVVVSFLLFFGLLLSPAFILRFVKKRELKYRFLIYLGISLFLTAIIICFFAWWTHYSNWMLLKHYGYNFDGTSATELYENVLSENIEKVEQLVISVMDTAWTLKAIITFLFYLPYLLMVYLFGYLINKVPKRNGWSNTLMNRKYKK